MKKTMPTKKATPAARVAHSHQAVTTDGVWLTLVVGGVADVLISSYNVSASDGTPDESLNLNFTKITVTFTSRDAKLFGAPTTTTYDLKKAQAS